MLRKRNSPLQQYRTVSLVTRQMCKKSYSNSYSHILENHINISQHVLNYQSNYSLKLKLEDKVFLFTFAFNYTVYA